jgi:uncharacterized protein
MKIAVIGTGISGLVAARQLSLEHEVTVLESRDRIGGHTHTVPVLIGERAWQVDTGFIVYNDRNYPLFSRLLSDLGVASKETSMSLSVSAVDRDFEYCGSSLDQLLAQRANLLSPRFHGMIRDIMRFHKAADAFLAAPDACQTMGGFVAGLGLGAAFRDYYLVPIMAAVWSAQPKATLEFPALFILRFLRNHGMTQVRGRPQWRVVTGGSHSYIGPLTSPYQSQIHTCCRVDKLLRHKDGIDVCWNGSHSRRFDRVFLATHSDISLRILGDEATASERRVLAAIPYQQNDVVLHTDTSLLPRRRRAWASWNYRVHEDTARLPSVTYNMNMLQGLDAPATFCVTLNDTEAIAPSKMIARFTYSHPLFSAESAAAQARHRAINGRDGVYFCGAYWGNGFHEDGVRSASDAVSHFQADCVAQHAGEPA